MEAYLHRISDWFERFKITSTHPSPSIIVGRKTPNPLIATDEVKKAMPRR